MFKNISSMQRLMDVIKYSHVFVYKVPERMVRKSGESWIDTIIPKHFFKILVMNPMWCRLCIESVIEDTAFLNSSVVKKKKENGHEKLNYNYFGTKKPWITFSNLAI